MHFELNLYTISNIAKIMAKITLQGYKCERCKHEWVPRNKEEYPNVCPKCKSPYWDKPRKKSNKE